MALDRLLEVLRSFRRRQTERVVERVEIEEVMMHTTWRTGTAVVVLAETVQPLDDAGRNIVFLESSHGRRDIPHQPVRERAARSIGVCDLQSQAERGLRHVGEIDLRRHGRAIAGVLLRDRAVIRERRTGDRHRARRCRRLSRFTWRRFLSIRIHARDGECKCHDESESGALHGSLRLESYNRAMPTFFEALNDLMAAELPLVVVTVVDTLGSVPQDGGVRTTFTA